MALHPEHLEHKEMNRNLSVSGPHDPSQRRFQLLIHRHHRHAEPHHRYPMQRHKDNREVAYLSVAAPAMVLLTPSQTEPRPSWFAASSVLSSPTKEEALRCR